MDVHLSALDPRDSLRLFLDNVLVAEIAVGVVSDQAALAAEIEQARCLKALATFIHHWQHDLERVKDLPDPVERTPAARQAAFCRGLEDGLCDRTAPHPYPGVPPVLPEHSAAYRAGYHHGEAMARCVTLALGTPPGRHAVGEGVREAGGEKVDYRGC